MHSESLHPSGLRARTIAAMAAALIAVPTLAQDLSGFVGTVAITADTLLRSGEMAGCTLNYQAAVQDYTYRNGALVVVAGSFNLNLIEREGGKTIAPLLKVGVQQLYPDRAGGPQAPAFAYLQSARGSTARSVRGDDYSETPGFRIFALTLDKDTAGVIGDFIEGDPVSLNYSSTKGGLDVKVPLDIRVVGSKPLAAGFERIRAESTLETFRACFMKLASKLK